jgi:AGZA family xanthine/uracil permease-like MFS transporter
MAMSYIAVVNPRILSAASAVTPDDPFPFRSVVSATCLTAMVAGVCLGVVANLPFCVVSGMGLNAFFAVGVCSAYGVSWRVGLGVCAVHSVLLMICIATGLCSWVQRVVPENVKKAITSGIGLFQAFIGFQMMGLVVHSDATLVTLGDATPGVVLAVFGLFLVVVLVMYNVKGGILVGILAATSFSWILRLSPAPAAVFETPTLSGTFLGLDLRPLIVEPDLRLWGSAIGFLFVSIFDIAGVQFGIGMRAGLIGNDGLVPRGDSAFMSAALGSLLGALTGTSPVIIANESTAGVVEGGRTGLTAIVVAVLFGLTAGICPILEAVPPEASAVPLVVVGLFMAQPLRAIDWDDMFEAFPAFMTVTVMPFTYSIANGVLAGVASHLVLVAVTSAVRSGRRLSSGLLSVDVAAKEMADETKADAKADAKPEADVKVKSSQLDDLCLFVNSNFHEIFSPKSSSAKFSAAKFSAAVLSEVVHSPISLSPISPSRKRTMADVQVYV